MIMEDVRVVRLIRKEISQKYRQNMEGQEEKLSFLATDYFDVMQVESIDIGKTDNPLPAVMGIWPAEMPGEDEIVAHSYSLYFNEKMLEQENGKAWCGDPFAEADGKYVMPILSLIQVYIVPDIMARALPEATADVLVSAIYNDLHETIEQFKKQSPDAIFMLRIYKVLSTGDFAIAIRSAKVETSFQIASTIRQRTMGTTSDQNSLKLVMYKTYTLLTFNKCVIQTEKALGKAQFVLRGCYSNLYWSKKEEIENSLADKNLWSNTELFGLNGRYDFSVRILENEFKQLYPLIQIYKEGGVISPISLDEKQDVSIVDYIMYLMSNKYLSYINERCLIFQTEWKVHFTEKSSGSIKDSSSDFEENDFLVNKINGYYTTVKGKYSGVRKKLAEIPIHRKNLMQYTELLGKLVQLCYSINGSSDARVYAAALLEQLDVTIDSIEVYIEMYYSEELDESDKKNIIDLLEVYIRESVQALDSYAKYIRNRNLQTIQTPNYNLESNMGMEKLLIGYSEMLDIFARFYQKNCLDVNSGNKTRALLPIVIPALYKGDKSVEVLFMEGVTKNWATEKAIWENTNRREIRHCMVVSVPTLMELGDVRTMVVTLFHENAHQFHDYEPVEQRNDAILRYAVHTLMGQVADELAVKMQRELGCYEKGSWFAQFLQTNLATAYLRYFYKDNDEKKLTYPFQNAPLNNFQEHLVCDFEYNLKKKVQVVDFKEHFGDFLRELCCYLIHEEKRYNDAIILMNELIQAQMNQKQNDQEESVPLIMVERIKKCAYVLALECAYQNRGDAVRRNWEEGDCRTWVTETSINNFDFSQDWKDHFDIGSHCENEKEPCCMIWKIFYEFANWVNVNSISLLKDVQNNTKGNSETEKSFYKEAYEYLCKAWEKQEDRKEAESYSARVREAMSRMLGIDYNSTDNEKIFEEELSSIFQQNLSGLKDGVKWRIGKYREETADMMMCNVLELSPFGYLSLVVTIWPIESNLLDALVSRFINVFLFQWCLDNGDICLEKILNNYIDLVSNIENAVASLDKDYEVKIYKEELQDDEDMVYDKLEKALADLEIHCEKMRINNNDMQNLERIKVCRDMATLAKMFIDFGSLMIDYMDEYEELKEDYIRVVERYRGLNDKMCKDNNPIVQEVGRFCQMIGNWQNDSYGFLKNETKQKEMNRRSIDFLLNMYYTNKRRIAQEVSDKHVL